jgi:large subunit ribosomal protein L5e
MGFVKVIKNKAYFKRYQVKYRRRREGKTDYYARKRLVCQDKCKYNSPKYRFVVRFTNTKVICQIIYAELTCDKVLCSAYSTELPRYGLPVGLKNFSAAYCTGLLCARRLLKQLGLDEAYEGNTEVTGEIVSCEQDGRKFYVKEVDEEKRPFRANLDTGLKPTTTGSNIFAALKGAVDGGLDIPHSEKRFPGYDRDEKKYDAEVMKARIFGNHVSEYMTELEEEDATAYNKLFPSYIAAGIKPDDLEELLESVHEKIREDPSPSAKETPAVDKKFQKRAKLSLAQRKARVAAKKAVMAARDNAEGDAEDDAEDEGDAEDGDE